MTLPSEFFATPLGHAEFRLGVSLYHLSDAVGLVDATMEELEVLTGMGRESLRRALRGLEEAGLVATTRTKRNLGKYYTNRYKLILPSLESGAWEEPLPLENEAWTASPPLESEASTAGQVVPIGTGKLSSHDSQVSNIESTTYFLVHADGVHPKKEVVLGNSERWKPRGEDTYGDDAIGGFGLLEEPAEVQQAKLSVNKRDTKTRGRRPQSEWTANDVAAEFSFQLGKRFPYMPGLVNVQALRGALLKYRSSYGVTADVEMELMRMFFEDENNLHNIEQYPNKVHGRFLNMFKSHLQKAHERLGLSVDYRVLGSNLEATVDTEEPDDYLYSSDGKRRFDNTVSGRAFLARYEEKLKGNS